MLATELRSAAKADAVLTPAPVGTPGRSAPVLLAARAYDMNAALMQFWGVSAITCRPGLREGPGYRG
jgi:hypothetical protein